MDPEPLSPETRRQIENELDAAVARTRSAAGAFVRYLKKGLAVVVVLLVVAWLTDYIQLRRSARPTGSVEIKRYFAVGLKNGKTEMMYAEPQTETCVNAVFPHQGYSPCWYVARHAVRQIEL
jgi:hypothetical protein